MSPRFQILLYYKYVRIADPAVLVEAQRALCESLGVCGRILIAGEGINGTVSGEETAARAYMTALRTDERFADMAFKIDSSEGHAFPKLSIKVRDEIVALDLGDDDIDPDRGTGSRLSPVEFLAAMLEDDVIVLDGRNNYESALGHFRGALCPDVEHFRDFPDWIRENLSEAKEKKILTYCTGGIRCEKLSGFLVREGFGDVAQLDGGIVSYGKDERVRGRNFDGQCYVFDQRIGVEVNRTGEKQVVATCTHCGEACERYVNCAHKPCNAQTFICPDCEASFGRYCREACRSA